MKTAMSIVSLGLVALLATAPLAWAQAASGGASGTPGTSTPDPSASPSGTAAPSASPASGEFKGRHTMTGEITKIDSRTGMFSLKTSEGTLDLHAPPSALAGVNTGDRVMVEIAVSPMK